MRRPNQGQVALLSALILALIVGVPLALGLITAPYFAPGDEIYTIRSLRQTVERQTLLPNRYTYPSMTYNVALATFAPAAALDLWNNRASLTGSGGELVEAIEANLLALINSDAFQDTVRRVFVAITYLTPLWVFLALRRWRRSIPFGMVEALIGAGVLALSWEVAYQARGILPNALTMQFGALTFVFIVYALTAERSARAQSYLRLAAVAAAVTCTSKYQGGLLLLFVLIVAFFLYRDQRRVDRASPVPIKSFIREGIVLIALFVAAFFITMPGALIQPTIFARGVRYEIVHYSVTGHNAHNVARGLEHLALNLGYFGMAAFSRYPAVALSIAALVLLGAAAVIARDRRLAVVLIGFPVLFILYMSTQRVMFTRNLLIALPFLAVLAGRGAGLVIEALAAGLTRLRQGDLSPSIRWISTGVVTVIVSVLFVVNGAWLVESSQKIVDPPVVDEGQQIADYIESAGGHVYVTASIAARLDAGDIPLPANATRNVEAADQVMFYAGELRAALRADGGRFIPINRANYYTYLEPYPFNVNPDYIDQPPNRPLVLDRAEWDALGVSVD